MLDGDHLAKYLPWLPIESDGSYAMVLHTRPHASHISQYTLPPYFYLVEFLRTKINIYKCNKAQLYHFG